MALSTVPGSAEGFGTWEGSRDPDMPGARSHTTCARTHTHTHTRALYNIYARRITYTYNYAAYHVARCGVTYTRVAHRQQCRNQCSIYVHV